MCGARDAGRVAAWGAGDHIAEQAWEIALQRGCSSGCSAALQHNEGDFLPFRLLRTGIGPFVTRTQPSYITSNVQEKNILRKKPGNVLRNIFSRNRLHFRIVQGSAQKNHIATDPRFGYFLKKIRS